jgi:hypothetical protein
MKKLEMLVTEHIARSILRDQQQVYQAVALQVPTLYRDRFSLLVAATAEDQFLRLNATEHRQAYEQARMESRRWWHTRFTLAGLIACVILLGVAVLFYVMWSISRDRPVYRVHSWNQGVHDDD